MGSLRVGTTERLHFHALEKEMAAHYSVLAWRIPGTEESSGLLSMGSQSRTRLKQLSSSNNSGDPSSIPGSGSSPGEGIGYPLQYSWASLVAQMVKNPPEGFPWWSSG